MTEQQTDDLFRIHVVTSDGRNILASGRNFLEVQEFRPLGRDSLCPSGATRGSTMPAPSGFLGWATGEKISGFSRFLILIKYEKQK